MKNTYRVLCLAGHFIDQKKLANGLYSVNIPYLYPPKTTMQDLVERTKRYMADTQGNERYLSNLKSCSLELFRLESVDSLVKIKEVPVDLRTKVEKMEGQREKFRFEYEQVSNTSCRTWSDGYFKDGYVLWLETKLAEKL